VTQMTCMFSDSKSFNQPIGVWNVSNVLDMNFMFDNSIFSTMNYDNLLINWSQLSLRNNVKFSAGTTKYSQIATSARQSLIDNFGWIITDGGLIPNVPDAPVLQTISSPSTTGNITLQWSIVTGANSYKIYRSLSEILSIDGLTPIATTDMTSYSDYGLSEDSYYFAIVAANASGDSPISNCEYVIVDLPATVPTAPQNVIIAETGDGWISNHLIHSIQRKGEKTNHCLEKCDTI
jgi:hypothetical protein